VIKPLQKEKRHAPYDIAHFLGGAAFEQAPYLGVAGLTQKRILGSVAKCSGHVVADEYG
jgi:hypothetical protein